MADRQKPLPEAFFEPKNAETDFWRAAKPDHQQAGHVQITGWLLMGETMLQTIYQISKMAIWPKWRFGWRLLQNAQNKNK